MPTFFVYGTLTDRARADALLEEWAFGPEAVLEGLHRETGRYPTLAPGGSVSGRLLRTDDVAALDAYEGVDDGLYVRASVPRTDGGRAFVYVGDPARLGVDAEWPGSGDLRARVEAYCEENDAVVRPIAPGDDERQTNV